MEASEVILVAGTSRSSYETNESDHGLPSAIPAEINRDRTNISHDQPPSKLAAEFHPPTDLKSIPNCISVPDSQTTALNRRHKSSRRSQTRGNPTQLPDGTLERRNITFSPDNDDVGSYDSSKDSLPRNAFSHEEFEITDPMDIMQSSEDGSVQEPVATIARAAYFRIDTIRSRRPSPPNSNSSNRIKPPQYFSLNSRTSPYSCNTAASWTPLHNISPCDDASHGSSRTQLEAAGRWMDENDHTDEDDDTIPIRPRTRKSSLLHIVPEQSQISPSVMVIDSNWQPNCQLTSNTSSEIPFTLSPSSNMSSGNRNDYPQPDFSCSAMTSSLTYQPASQTSADRMNPKSYARLSDEFNFDVSSNASPSSSVIEKTKSWKNIQPPGSDRSSTIDQQIHQSGIHRFATNNYELPQSSERDSSHTLNQQKPIPGSSTSSVYLSPAIGTLRTIESPNDEPRYQRMNTNDDPLNDGSSERQTSLEIRLSPKSFAYDDKASDLEPLNMTGQRSRLSTPRMSSPSSSKTNLQDPTPVIANRVACRNASPLQYPDSDENTEDSRDSSPPVSEPSDTPLTGFRKDFRKTHFSVPESYTVSSAKAVLPKSADSSRKPDQIVHNDQAGIDDNSVSELPNLVFLPSVIPGNKSANGTGLRPPPNKFKSSSSSSIISGDIDSGLESRHSRSSHGSTSSSDPIAEEMYGGNNVADLSKTSPRSSTEFLKSFHSEGHSESVCTENVPLAFKGAPSRGSQFEFSPSPLSFCPDVVEQIDHIEDRLSSRYDNVYRCQNLENTKSPNLMFLKEPDIDPPGLAGHREVISIQNDVQVLISMARQAQRPDEMLFVCQVLGLGHPNRGDDLIKVGREKWKFAPIDEMATEREWPPVVNHTLGVSDEVTDTNKVRGLYHRGREEIWYFRTSFRGQWRNMPKIHLLLRIVCSLFALQWPCDMPLENVTLTSMMSAEGSSNISAVLQTLRIMDTELVKRSRRRVTCNTSSNFMFMDTLGCEMLQDFLICTLRIPGFLYFDQNVYSQAIDVNDLVTELSHSKDSEQDSRSVIGKRNSRSVMRKRDPWLPGATLEELQAVDYPVAAKAMRFTYWKPTESKRYGAFLLLNLASGRFLCFTPRSDSAEAVIAAFKEMLLNLRFPNFQLLVPDPIYLKFIRLQIPVESSGEAPSRLIDNSPGGESDVAVGGSPVKKPLSLAEDWRADLPQTWAMAEFLLEKWSRDHECGESDSVFITRDGSLMSIDLNYVERQDEDSTIVYESFLTLKSASRCRGVGSARPTIENRGSWNCIHLKLFEHLPSLANLFSIFRSGLWFLIGLYEFSNSPSPGVRRALFSTYWPESSLRIQLERIELDDTQMIVHEKYETIDEYYHNLKRMDQRKNTGWRKESQFCRESKSIFIPFVASNQYVPTFTPHMLDPVLITAQKHLIQQSMEIPPLGVPSVFSNGGPSPSLFGPPVYSKYGSQILMPTLPEVRAPYGLSSYHGSVFGWVREQPSSKKPGIFRVLSDQIRVPREIRESAEWHFPGTRAILKSRLAKQQDLFPPKSNSYLYQCHPDIRYTPIPSISIRPPYG